MDQSRQRDKSGIVNKIRALREPNNIRELSQSDLDKLKIQVNAWLKAKYFGKSLDGHIVRRYI